MPAYAAVGRWAAARPAPACRARRCAAARCRCRADGQPQPQPQPDASQRRQKDPSAFKSMDDLRDSLTRESRPGLLTAFVSASPRGGWAVWLQRLAAAVLPPSSVGGQGRAMGGGVEADPAAVSQLQALLLGSRASTLKLISSYPGILEMDRQELLQRIVALKDLFPGSDVARMIALQPALFLDGAWPPKAAQLEAAAALLRSGLAGADLDLMFQEDSAILFYPLPSLRAGLEQLHDLWPGLTPDALAASSPLHLSLAVKALGPDGPPKGF